MVTINDNYSIEIEPGEALQCISRAHVVFRGGLDLGLNVKMHPYELVQSGASQLSGKSDCLGSSGAAS